MSAFERPADDREDGTLAAHELPCRDSEEGATCPLLQGKVQLLPLRYGLVETLTPGITTPYQLSARPLGIRLIRNGYLYVLDGNTNELEEYPFSEEGSSVSGKLEYETDRTLYVCFSEVEWTDAKRAQVQESEEERDAFMQAVNLEGANPITGGSEHLITTAQAEEWVAEFAEDAQPEMPEGGHEQEGEAYHWENDHYYHKTRLGKLLKQHDVEDRDECLCLIVRDDIGVMRDLAQFQDNVVDWHEAWETEREGKTKRDYVLGSYIDSLISINEDSFLMRAQGGDDEAVALLEETDEAQRQTIYDHLIAKRDHNGAIPIGTESHWRDKRYADNEYVQTFLAMRDSLGDALYEKHRDLITRLNLETFHTLNGRSLGQRGINQLIDRGRMEQTLAQEGAKLSRWSAILDAISRDRADMLCQGRFHKAAWYFDAQHEEQLALAFETEYACTRDICRNDESIDAIADWLEQSPEFDRPLFHTLTLQDQGAMAIELGNLVSASYAVGTRSIALLENLDEWADRLQALEQGKLPDITELPDDVHATAVLARENLTPAVGRGIANAMESIALVLEGNGVLPPLEELFRNLPKALGHRLMSAAREGGVTFQLANEGEVTHLRRLIQHVLLSRIQLRRLNSQMSQLRDRRQHGSERYDQLNQEKRQVQQRLAPLEEQLARAISPIEGLPAGAERVTAPGDAASVGKARAGLTIVASGTGVSSAQLQQSGGMIRSIRQGYRSASSIAKGGDALSLLIFLAQAVNLWATVKESQRFATSDPLAEGETIKFLQAVFGTAAAGLLAAQAVGHTALSSHAHTLTQALGAKAQATKTVYAQMGRLHILIGGFGYLAGFVAALFSLRNDFSNWQAALRNGNRTAQYGALTAAGGSAGWVGTLGYSLQRSAITGRDVLLRRITLAVAGRYLGQVLVRVNLLSLVFSLLQLGGTWVYNRHNLDRHDRWLTTTPWGSANREASLDAYTAELASITQAVHITLARRDDHYVVGIILPSLAKEAFQTPLGGRPSLRISCQAWQIRPEPRNRRIGPGPAQPGERWRSMGEEFGASLRLLTSASTTGVAIHGLTPSRRSTPEHYALAVRFERLNDVGEYQSNAQDIQLLYLNPALGTGPGSHYQPTDSVTAPIEPNGWYVMDPRTMVIDPGHQPVSRSLNG
ncbi:toxin VasX [Vreelandella olivaria]|uniref:toxin VasX n=1 Tax=Vreelandella olivaria TaxID=390919 RepID=UPI00201F56F6|nr:toxin VasX [Halomonas olivaria]